MLAKTFSAALQGIDATAIEVEVNATGEGEYSAITIVGLPDVAVKESRDRVKSAIMNSGYFLPHGMIVVNLAPADVKKEGAAYDLPIALGILAADGHLDRSRLSQVAFLGELALDGVVRPIRGALPIALELAKNPKIRALMVPDANVEEAALATSGKIPVHAISSLTMAIDYCKGAPLPDHQATIVNYFEQHRDDRMPDFAEVKGQTAAKRAIEIAAAGGHNTLMIGPPGTGKSMLAQRLPGILPEMTLEETLETSKIHSILGLLSSGQPLMNVRPFRAPHHTVSDAGLLGGGRNPLPGEISLAHNGVLFLDELPEFKRNVLEVLRQPLEQGTVTVSRAAGSFQFPARFILVAAMNPCPCGHYNNPKRPCRCTSSQITRYRSKISGPLLDRIDLHVEVAQLDEHELMSAPAGETSAVIRNRVKQAREVQQRRFTGLPVRCNAQMGPRELQQYCQLNAANQTLLRHAIQNYNLSARAYDRILRVARTIADLERSAAITEEHLFEAIGYRTLDQAYW